MNSLITTAVMAGVSFAASSAYSGSGSGAGDISTELPKGTAGPPVPASGMGPYRTGYIKQAGGYISSGPRNIDSIPAFMAGGEFVMNNKAVKKYGLGFMNRLNGGYIPKYQAGGSVAEVASELGSNSATNTNNINISINMGGSGSEQSTANSQGNDQGAVKDDQTRAKELSRKIKQVVVQTIRDEQRVGGSLSRTGNRNGQ